MGPSLFLDIVVAMGLDTDRARDSLARTLRRMNIDPVTMSPADVSRARPLLLDTLTMFMPPNEVGPRLQAVDALIAQHRIVTT